MCCMDSLAPQYTRGCNKKGCAVKYLSDHGGAAIKSNPALLGDRGERQRRASEFIPLLLDRCGVFKGSLHLTPLPTLPSKQM